MSNNKTEEIKYTPEWVMQMFEKSSEKFDADLKKSSEKFDADLKKSTEKFDADLKKSREEADRRSAEFEASFKKSREEADRMSAETNKKIKELTENVNATTVAISKTDDKMKELTEKFNATADYINKTTDAINNLRKEVGGIGESNGSVAEETIFNALAVDMTFGGVEFDESYRNMKKRIKAQNIEGEYDILLTNGNVVAIIEAKWDVKYGDASKLATIQVEKFRKLFPEYNGYKVMLGIGGISFESRAIEEAKQQGVGIIKVIGNKVEFHTEGIKIF